MLYVLLADWKPGLSQEQQNGALARRAQWQYPATVKVVGEYWPATHAPAVITVFESDSYEGLMEISFYWQDVFDMHFFPATTAEEGLRTGQQVMERLGASQQAGG